MINNQQRVEALFKRFDTEGDGVVTVQVFRAGANLEKVFRCFKKNCSLP